MKPNQTIAGIVVVLVLVGAWYYLQGASPQVQQADSIVNSSASSTMQLTSTAFKEGQLIPQAYTCDGQQINPPLAISAVPEGAVSLALIMDDPDVPKSVLPAGVFDHWVLFNIPATTDMLESSSTVGVPGNNGAGKPGYTGPCPPPQYEPSTHRYVFVLYALDTELSLPAGASKAQVLEAMSGHILEQAQLIGTYTRKK